MRTVRPRVLGPLQGEDSGVSAHGVQGAAVIRAKREGPTFV